MKDFISYWLEKQESTTSVGIKNMMKQFKIDEDKFSDFKKIFVDAEKSAQEKGIENPYAYAYGAVRQAIKNSKKK